MSTKTRLDMLVTAYMANEFSMRKTNTKYAYELNMLITQLLGNVFIDLANIALKNMSQNDDPKILQDFYWAFDYLSEITSNNNTKYQIKPIDMINTISMHQLISLLKHKNDKIHSKALQTILTIIGSPHDTTQSETEILIKVKDLQKVIAFTQILSKPSNQTCIDCNTPNPEWASVNNACFICIQCAGNHRSMGVHISFVRSVTMDSWNKIQLARMTYGGNTNLKQFWMAQKFPIDLTPKQRLNNEAMDKYRDALLSMAK
eukprot:255299_1